MKKLFSVILSAMLLMTLLPAGAMAASRVSLDEQQGGRLLITDPGTYTLTGAMRGTLWVDPGAGDVTLILDNMIIDGGDSAGIAAVSGDSLRVILADGTVNRVSDSSADPRYGAAIFCGIPAIFEGNGRLDVLSSNPMGIRGMDGDLTFASGSYFIRSARDSVDTDGQLSVQNAVVTDMNTRSALTATPVMEVQTGNSGKLNLRQEPTTGADLVGRYTNGTQVTVLENQGEWSRVEVNGHTGYMMNQYLTPTSNRISVPSMQQAETSSGAGEIVTSTAVNNAASLEADYDNAEYITMSDSNNQVKISDSGTYVVTGSSPDGNITVKKGTTGVVLVLDDLDLTSTTGATVAVNKEAQVKIIVSGNVTLTDNENPADEYSADADVADAFDGAAMKFKANSQVYITGDGNLTLNGNAKNGIKAGDDSSLIFDGGVTVNITAVNDGVNGNYDVTLLDGDFTIAAGDDAIHADHILTLGREDGTGPNVRIIASNEGLEGTVVNMFGGNVSIRSKDDAINAANGDGLYEGELAYSFNMTGGRITVNSQGDGIDSNGNINLIGGVATINSASMGGEAGVDYDGQYYIAGNFQMNNASGVAGPDQMPGSMMNAMNGGFGGPQNQQNPMGNRPFGQQQNTQNNE